MKRLIIALIMVHLALGFWEIHLKTKEVEFKGQKYPYDKVRYIELDQGRGNNAIQGKLVLDTTIDKNWIRSTSCSSVNCINDNAFKCSEDSYCKVKAKLDDTNFYDFDAIGSRANFLKATLGQITCTIEDREFTNEAVYFPTDVKPNRDTPVLTQFQGGFGLGRSYVNFVNDVSNKMRLEKRGFSFFFSQTDSSIIFGKENPYFTSEAFTTFENAEYDNTDGFKRTANNRWGLQVASINYGKSNNLDNSISLETKKLVALFDTTTQYIWTSQAIADRFTNILTNSLQNKCELNPVTKLQECNCDGNYPDIIISFSDHTEKQFKLHKSSYLQKFDDKANKCIFLVRGPYNFYPSTTTCTTDCTTPSIIVGPTSSNLPPEENYIILGTSFLESIYAHFDNEFNVIKLAQAYQPQHQSKSLNDTYRYVFIILGVFLVLISFIILFNILKSMEQKPSQKVVVQPTVVQYAQTNTPIKQYVIQQVPPISVAGLPPQQSIVVQPPITYSHVRPAYYQ